MNYYDLSHLHHALPTWKEDWDLGGEDGTEDYDFYLLQDHKCWEEVSFSKDVK